MELDGRLLGYEDEDAGCVWFYGGREDNGGSECFVGVE